MLRSISSGDIGSRVLDFPDGSPMRRVKSPTTRTAVCPNSWNSLSFRSTTACPNVS